MAKKTKEPKIRYTLTFFPPEEALIKTFATQFPWAVQFVRMKALTTNKKYDNVVIAMGGFKMSDGGQFQCDYEIAAVPDNSGIEFEDIVAGRGEVFKDLRHEIDMCLSAFFSLLIAEVKEDIATGKITQDSEENQGVKENIVWTP